MEKRPFPGHMALFPLFNTCFPFTFNGIEWLICLLGGRHMNGLYRTFLDIRTLVQQLAMLLFLALAIGLTCATALALMGVLPWPEIILFWNQTQLATAGMWMQIALTVFAITLCFFLPSNARIMRLETSHRRFNIAMEDITRAYIAAHAADRDGTFQLTDEFEQMRTRLAFLRDHPDLGDLEPELLELAAQMSFQARDLAERYSDKRVARARGFLEQRQQELERFNERLEDAKAINAEFRLWLNRIELEESVATSQLERLLNEFEKLLPELNAPVEVTDSKVAMLPTRKD
jgi:hypothetical protein